MYGWPGNHDCGSASSRKRDRSRTVMMQLNPVHSFNLKIVEITVELVSSFSMFGRHIELSELMVVLVTTTRFLSPKMPSQTELGDPLNDFGHQ